MISYNNFESWQFTNSEIQVNKMTKRQSYSNVILQNNAADNSFGGVASRLFSFNAVIHTLVNWNSRRQSYDSL